jgi:hypothetical protein
MLINHQERRNNKKKKSKHGNPHDEEHKDRTQNSRINISNVLDSLSSRWLRHQHTLGDYLLEKKNAQNLVLRVFVCSGHIRSVREHKRKYSHDPHVISSQ